MVSTNAIVILDGFGYSTSTVGNAIFESGTPNIKMLLAKYANGFLNASGRAVGLPEGQMGNSEVGHLNLGAGRVVYQDITQIDKSIEDGDFFTNDAFLGAIENVKKNKSAMHLVGLTSPGGVHSHTNHLYALLKLCKKKGLKRVFVHCITDGRDVPPDSAKQYIADLEAKILEIGVGKIASVVGRYFYMDRDNRWERVEKGYHAVFDGEGAEYTSADAGVAASYALGKFDEFIEPIIADGYEGVKKGDSMIFYNFRSDRAREISEAILTKDFASFTKRGGHKDIFYVGMTQYDASFKGIHTAFAPKDITNTLGEYLAKQGKTQARVAETEKYAHVTFFFNGGVETANKGEERILVKSPEVATYDLKPEMSAYEVTEKALGVIGKVDVLILNYANCDMVGHTGIMSAAVKAVNVVDECVKKITDKILKVGGNMILTADHGNAEQMMFESGAPFTAHTTNPVRVIVVGKGYERDKANVRKGGGLNDVAPTLLSLMGLEKPKEMDGKNLVVKI